MRIQHRFFIAAVVMILYGCQNLNPTATVTVSPTDTPTLLPPAPTSTPTVVSEEWLLWNESPHADTYDLSQGSNTYCAKCHSPFNGEPGVQLDHAMTVTQGNWKSIDCAVCHETNGDAVSTEVAWWDQTSHQYQTITSDTDLCKQCHQNSDVPNHQIEFSDSAHPGFGCSDCHNPHSTSASCVNSGCHADIRPESARPPSTPTGGQHPNNGSAFCGGPSCHPAATQVSVSYPTIHGAAHATVACTACHDASGLQVGPSEELGVWVPFRSRDISGVLTTEPYVSHNIQIEVECTRCHFDGNQWGLPLVTGHEFGN